MISENRSNVGIGTSGVSTSERSTASIESAQGQARASGSTVPGEGVEGSSVLARSVELELATVVLHDMEEGVDLPGMFNGLVEDLRSHPSIRQIVVPLLYIEPLYEFSRSLPEAGMHERLGACIISGNLDDREKARILLGLLSGEFSITAGPLEWQEFSPEGRALFEKIVEYSRCDDADLQRLALDVLNKIVSRYSRHSIPQESAIEWLNVVSEAQLNHESSQVVDSAVWYLYKVLDRSEGVGVDRAVSLARFITEIQLSHETVNVQRGALCVLVRLLEKSEGMTDEQLLSIMAKVTPRNIEHSNAKIQFWGLWAIAKGLEKSQSLSSEEVLRFANIVTDNHLTHVEAYIHGVSLYLLNTAMKKSCLPNAQKLEIAARVREVHLTSSEERARRYAQRIRAEEAVIRASIPAEASQTSQCEVVEEVGIVEERRGSPECMTASSILLAFFIAVGAAGAGFSPGY